MSKGDYFGEVAFLFDTKRTSTIKAKLYATVGRLNWHIMEEMLRDNPDFKKHLLNEVVDTYDDDLKLFMITALRRVDYLKKASKEVLCSLAYSCRPC